MKYCIDCGKQVSRNDVTRCRHCANLGKLNPQYKTGKKYDGQGYVVVKSIGHPFIHHDGYVFEHRLVMEKKIGRYLTKDEFIDHINGVRDDNRIENLRLCTKSQNSANKKSMSNNYLGYKGIFKSGKKYGSRIKCKQKLIHIGVFNTKKEAAHAYDKKALELFGEFAHLNFTQK